MREIFAILNIAFPLMVGFWVIKFFNNPKNADFIIQLRSYLL
jgi:hypothetical protein